MLDNLDRIQPDNPQQGQINVAVIGTGLAGLTAGFLLSNQAIKFNIHVFEKVSE
jgi:cation diffusion facilitator CzcD-associated flavoprotein CzcO